MNTYSFKTIDTSQGNDFFFQNVLATLWHGKIDLIKQEISSEFSTKLPLPGQGEMKISMRTDQDEQSQRTLSYAINRHRSIEPIDALQEYEQAYKARQQSLLRLGDSDGKSSSQWNNFEKSFKKILDWQYMRNMVFTLQRCGQIIEGSSEDEKFLLESLNTNIDRYLQQFHELIRTKHDGLNFVSALLHSKDKQDIRLGLSLVNQHSLGAFQRELLAIYQNDTLPADLHKLSRAFLLVERRRSLPPKTHRILHQGRSLLHIQAEKPRGASVLLIYSDSDVTMVSKIYRRLLEEGFIPWMAAQDLLPEEGWKNSIQRALRSADFVLVCLSQNIISKRGFLRTEIRYALELWKQKLERDIFLIPVRLEPCETPEELEGFHGVDLMDEAGWPSLVEALHAGMT